MARPAARARSGARWADAAWCAVRLGGPVGRGEGPFSRSVSMLWRPAGGAGAPSFALGRLDGVCAPRPRGPYVCDVHLRVNPNAPARAAWAEYADVLVVRQPLAPAEARRRATELIARYPGCLVAAVSDSREGCALAVRGGDDVLVVRWHPSTELIASVAHAWLTAGGSWAGLRSVGLSLRAVRAVRACAPDR